MSDLGKVNFLICEMDPKYLGFIMGDWFMCTKTDLCVPREYKT